MTSAPPRLVDGRFTDEMAFPYGAKFGLGARARPDSAACARCFADRRSVAAAGASRPRLRPVPGAAPARGDATAGGDRRYRREEPANRRPVAVAAHAHRRSRQPADANGRAGDRRSTSCSPSRTGCRRASPPTFSAISTTRRESKLRALPSNDAVFADAHAQFACGAGRIRPAVRSRRSPRAPSRRSVLQPWAATRGHICSNFPGLLRNVPVLEQAGSGRGLFTIRAERDGIVRRVPIVMQAQGTIMPSLTLEMLRVVSGSSTVLIRSDNAGVQSAAVPGFVIPTDRNGQLWIHFAPHDLARYVSAADILEGKVPADRVARRLGAGRNFGGRTARFKNDADRSGHAGRRSARAGA